MKALRFSETSVTASRHVKTSQKDSSLHYIFREHGHAYEPPIDHFEKTGLSDERYFDLAQKPTDGSLCPLIYIKLIKECWKYF
jgi:hypothetical protein